MNQSFNSYTIQLSNEQSTQAHLFANREGKTVEEFVVKCIKIIMSNAISNEQMKYIFERDEIPNAEDDINHE